FGIRELLRRFGYFWASKVMKRIGIRELLRRFGYFWVSKVTRKFTEKYLTPSNCFLKQKSTFRRKPFIPQLIPLLERWTACGYLFTKKSHNQCGSP
ncbi:hypothetical protein, partial [Sphingobacterium sp.]|uniref:hypothetical protein n=1 Tax=Sphingobacterium sp. TaxID=341027 RepID=UPI0028A85009